MSRRLGLLGLVASWMFVMALPVGAEGDRVLPELRAMCERLYAGDDNFFGRQPTEALRQQVATADRLGDARRMVLLRGQLGTRQLLQGDLDDAATTFDQALERAEAAGLAIELRDQLRLSRALVALQQAEDRNCLGLHSAASCILPFTDEARHQRPEDATLAGDLIAETATRQPGDPVRRWLLILSRMLTGGYPAAVPETFRAPTGAFAEQGDVGRFVDRAHDLGVATLDLSGGAVIDDFDGDGRLDLISSTWDPCGSMAAYRNDGQGSFEDVTRAWGLDRQLGGLNLVHADYDGDGALDLMVLRGGWLGKEGRMRNSLLRNDLAESGEFVDTTHAAGLALPAFPSQTAAWADYDLDGDLDVFIGNEAEQAAANVGGRGASGLGVRSYPSQLFRNLGDGTFSEVARTAGVANRGFTKGVAWGDIDNDGDDDLYLSNLGPNALYRNDGGTFTDITMQAGVAAPLDASFGTVFFDVDNDGDLDLFVAGYSAPVEEVFAWYLTPAARRSDLSTGHPMLYRNDGTGRFVEASEEMGLRRPLLPMGFNVGDVDGDGFLDLYLGTGVPDIHALMPNILLRNLAGERFVDATFAAGLGHVQKGHGVAFGDLDGDGDEDLFEQMGGAYPFDAYTNTLFENPGWSRWLVLRLEAAGANSHAVGARVTVRCQGGQTIHRRVDSGGSFGGNSHQLEIGLGSCASIESIDVDWPSGATQDQATQSFTNIEADAAYRLVEGAPSVERLEYASHPLSGGNQVGHTGHGEH
ncbi:MAG: CRTAC1 family protein [Acidobacteriota bacterium]